MDYSADPNSKIGDRFGKVNEEPALKSLRNELYGVVLFL